MSEKGLDHVATAIHTDCHQVQVDNQQGGRRSLTYDRLVVATGAEPVRPTMPGLDLPGVYVLHTMDDSLRVHEHLAARTVREAAIVGSGYIGMEMADALTHRDVHVTLLGRAASVLPTVDQPLGRAAWRGGGRGGCCRGHWARRRSAGRAWRRAR